MHEQIRQLKRFAVMTGTAIALAVMLIAATRPNQAMDRIELVGLAVTWGLATGGTIWIIAWIIELSRGRK